MKSLFVFWAVQVTAAFELMHLERRLVKNGLHRDLENVMIMRIDSEDELNSQSLVFRE